MSADQSACATPSTLRRRAGLLALGLLMLATMELCARLDDWVTWRAPLWANADFDALFRSDGTVVRGVPLARYARWQLNSAGMRGPEPRPAAGQQRVIVYGASEVFGIYEDNGREFPRALQRQLDASPAGPGYEVLNAGVPGMRIGSGTDYLKELGARFNPAVVVLYPTPTHYIGVSRPNCGRPPRPATPATAPAQSRLAAKLVDRVKAVLPPAVMTQARRLSIWRATRHEPALPAIAPVSMAALSQDLDCAIAAVRAIGAVPLLVTHANRFGVEHRDDDRYWLTGWRMQYPEMMESGFLDLEKQANALVIEAGRRTGTRVVDADAALSGRAGLFRDHAHFSNEGADLMGRLLAGPVREAVADR